MTLRWRIVPNSAPALRQWGDEYVVHHALSNDTYRLSAPGGRILTELMAADLNHEDGIGSDFSPEKHVDLDITLSALAELGFVTQC